MLLTISNTAAPATDFGYLLHKNPARAQSFDLSFGTVRVWYPEASDEVCTVALLLEIDPVRLSRGAGKKRGGFGLEPYVNDRPYVASSFLSVALAQVFREAMSGRSKERPELAQTALPLVAHLPVVPCHGGEVFLRRLFEPLGYEVETRQLPLAPRFPEWGQSTLYALGLRATVTLSDLLSHLYVLIPVLDDDKHYWVGDDEVEKLLRRGGPWLDAHPERETIAFRFLNHQSRLAREAVSQMTTAPAEEEAADVVLAQQNAEEAAIEEKSGPGLHTQRLNAVLQELRDSGATRVLDLGCGEGKLLKMLLGEKQWTQIVGVDVSHRALEIAAEKLHLDRMPELQKKRLTLLHGSLTYRDARWNGFDAAAVVEVVEHLDAARLRAFEKVLWGASRPKTIVLTTPNREYNARWESLPAGQFRHRDHRFEWTRSEFESWAAAVAERWGYSVRFAPLGPFDEQLGAPSQMGVWQRDE